MKLALWPKRVVYLLVAAVALSAARGAGLSWLQAALTLLPLVGVDVALRMITQRRQQAFDHALMGAIQRGETGALLDLYRRQTLLRFAAPRHYLWSKLGLIYQQLGRLEQAAVAYQDALSEAPADLRYTLAINLADILYALGEDREAERHYRLALEDGARPAVACANLARLVSRRGGDSKEAAQWMTEAVNVQRGASLRCELAHLLIASDALSEADEALTLAERERQERSVEPGEADEDDAQAIAKARAALSAARERAAAAEPEPLAPRDMAAASRR